MFNGGEFSKILDEIFEKDEKEKEKAIETYCKIWEYLENITLQNLKYKRAFEILKEIFDIRFEKDENGDCWIKIFPTTYDDRHILGEPTSEQYELLEELMKGEKN